MMKDEPMGATISIYSLVKAGPQKNLTLTEERKCSVVKLDKPSDVHKLMETLFKVSSLPEEFVWMLALDAKNEPLAVFEISHGSSVTSVCSSKSIFTRALLCDAQKMIIAHNHPSGDLTPSHFDLSLTCKLVQAGRLMDIPVEDHLILGNEFCSMRATNPACFDFDRSEGPLHKVGQFIFEYGAKNTSTGQYYVSFKQIAEQCSVPIEWCVFYFSDICAEISKNGDILEVSPFIENNALVGFDIMYCANEVCARCSNHCNRSKDDPDCQDCDVMAGLWD